MSMNQRMESFPTIQQLTEMGYETTASKIRYLRSLQKTEDRGAIAKFLGIKYQWVRNVLLQSTSVPNVIAQMTEDHLIG